VTQAWQGASADALHPTPQFARAGWTDLTGTWRFDYDDADCGLDQGWAAPEHDFGRQIRVPFPPESDLSQIGDAGFHRVLWYSRTFAGAAPGSDQRLVLHFGAVDHQCQVFVNGQLATEHQGGMTSFAVDITRLLDRKLDEQVLTVRVEDDPQDLAQPRGKQDWRQETAGIFYQRTSGIWQPVWLERVSDVHLVDVAWTTDLKSARIVAEIELSAAPQPGTSVKIVLDHRAERLAEVTVLATERRFTVALDLPILQMPMERGRVLWTPEQPNLVDATVEVVRAAKTMDRVDSYVGIRTVDVKDGRFQLNGHPYYLRMVLEQGYWPQSHLAAPSAQALRREVELIKELGFNGARIHQKVEDPRFLYWCDRLGLAVWGEMANSFVYTQRSRELLTREWPDVVRRDRSHPCILAWVPINESWGVPGIADDPAQQHFASAMYHLTKAIDPTRPAVSNEGWEHTESDIWGVHDYTPSADGIRERYNDAELQRTLTDRGPGRRRVLLGNPEAHGQPIMITEFGGLSYAPTGGQRWFGYSTISTDQEYTDRLESLITAIADQPGIAGFCYTQLTDTLQEANGLLRADRTPKLPVEVVHGLVTHPSRAIPAEEIDAHRRAARHAADGQPADLRDAHSTNQGTESRTASEPINLP